MSFDDVTACLSDPATHGTTTPVEVVRTHGALVFLTENDAYKVKQPVTYDYLDFSTLEKRKTMLDRELELNRPAAPEGARASSGAGMAICILVISCCWRAGRYPSTRWNSANGSAR